MNRQLNIYDYLKDAKNERSRGKLFQIFYILLVFVFGKRTNLFFQ
jgi:hypothetical protein